MNCPNCGLTSSSEMRFCGLCGTRLTSPCPECGFFNPVNFHYCGMCGCKLTQAEAPETQRETPSPTPASAGVSENAPLALVSLPLESERRVVTVIVTDLTNSTELLEKLGTEAWVDSMNRILHILESEIYRFGGEVSQFRGDGMVAFFGATTAHEDDPERAVLSALSMKRAFEVYLRDLGQAEAAHLRMRIGINTGEVIVARSGERHQWEETAMGLAIAVAARMETAAEPGSILVSENTYRLIETQFNWLALDEIAVKGVSQPLAVYRPLTHRTNPDRLPRGQFFPSSIPRIGRETEFRAIKECVAGLFNGRGRIATVLGDKGSGKSFILREVQQYFAHRGSLLAETQANPASDLPAVTWVIGRCRSYSQSWPYFMWVDLICDWLAFQPDDTKEEKLASLQRRTQELWGEQYVEHYPYIATFMGLPLEETFSEKICYLDGESLRQRFFLTMYRWIELASQRGPLVLSFADLQWADDSSLALLRHCLPICDSEAILWILTFRPERESAIRDFHHYLEVEYPHRLTSVNLLTLNADQSRQLIHHLIGAQTLPEETLELILHSAGGIPYYIIELITVLVSKGILACDEECNEWQLTRTVTNLDLPESLQQLLVARMDRLAAQERLVFQVAAVIGPVFWLNVLQALLGDFPSLKADLAALQRAQFIEESGRVPGLGMQYVITSPLLRDTAYESLLSNQRAGYHLKTAEYLESLSAPDLPDGYDGLLAYHYRGAGNFKQELFYTLLAADQARKIYANTEALQHYTRAIELLDTLQAGNPSSAEKRIFLTERFEVLNERRAVLYQLGKIVAAHQDTYALLPLAQQLEDDPVWLIDALLAQAEISNHNFEDVSDGLKIAYEALALSQRIGDQTREMFSLIRVANNLFILKDHTWHDHAGRALALARHLGDLKTEVNLLLGIGGAYGMDDLPRSREYLQEALSKSESLHDKATELALLEAIGQQFERDGNYYLQLNDYEIKRLHLSRQIGNRMAEGNALMFCGQIQALYLGDYERGLELEKQALALWENLHARLFPLLRIAQIQAAQGQYPEALATLELAAPLGEKAIADIGRAGLQLVTAIISNALGDEAHLLQVLDLIPKIQHMVANNLVSRQYQMTAACEGAAAHLQLAELKGGHATAEGQAHFLQALEMSQTALNMYEQFGFVQVVECTSEEILFRHSQALAANDQMATSAAYLKRAYQEMMRKHALIPTESPFHTTYLENIPLHREILAAYTFQGHR